MSWKFRPHENVILNGHDYICSFDTTDSLKNARLIEHSEELFLLLKQIARAKRLNFEYRYFLCLYTKIENLINNIERTKYEVA